MRKTKVKDIARVTALLIAIMLWLPTYAGDKDKETKYDIRLGYNIGGTAPLNMPATIRKLNKFELQPNVIIAVSAKHELKDKWGWMYGFRFENKNMKTDATVKNYYVDIVMGGQSLSGYYCGHNVTKVKEFMLTVPLLATYDLCRNVQLHAGPYVSVLLSKEFSGYVYDGHLRVGKPTGPKVEMGGKNGSHGSFDFSDDMRRIQYGLSAGADWQFSRDWGVYGEINWGLCGIHHSNFKIVDPTLYPIFGSFGMIYRL